MSHCNFGTCFPNRDFKVLTWLGSTVYAIYLERQIVTHNISRIEISGDVSTISYPLPFIENSIEILKFLITFFKMVVFANIFLRHKQNRKFYLYLPSKHIFQFSFRFWIIYWTTKNCSIFMRVTINIKFK